MQLTSNLNLKKPESTDNVNIDDLNGNADILDAEVTKLASTTEAGRMSAADKTKLNGIAAGAQVNSVSSVAGKTGAVSLVKADVGLGNVDNVQQAPISHVGAGGTAHAAATTTAAGFMSTADKTKLDGVAAGAQVNRSVSTQAQAQAGTDNTTDMTPLRVAEAIASLAPSAPVQSVAGKTGNVALVKGDVGLENVDNVQQASKTELDTHTTNRSMHELWLGTITPANGVYTVTNPAITSLTAGMRICFQSSIVALPLNPRIKINSFSEIPLRNVDKSPAKIYSGSVYTFVLDIEWTNFFLQGEGTDVMMADIARALSMGGMV